MHQVQKSKDMLIEIDEECIVPQCLRKDQEILLTSIQELEDKTLGLKPYEERDLVEYRKTLAAVDHLLSNWY